MSYWGQDDPELRNKLKYKVMLKNRIKSWLPKEGRYEYLSNWDYRNVRYVSISNYAKISINVTMQELEWIVNNKDSFLGNLRYEL